MELYHLVVLFHVLGATVWTGGHLILAITLLPGALKHHDTAFLKAFEEKYERIGIPALLVQVITGIYLSFHYVPTFDHVSV